MNDVGGRLAGKVAIVTGAGQTPGETIGNGRAISVLFARAGAHVICADRDLERADETVEMIRAEGGAGEAMQADVTSQTDCEMLIARARDGLERLDILVNNVGIGGGGDAPAHRLTEDAFDRIMEVNLKSAWRMIAEAVPVMRDAGGGSIVNISSLAAIATSGMTAYELSKAAMNRLTVNVAMGNARYGVRCNAIAPGLMDTPMAIVGNASFHGVEADEIRQKRAARVPLRQQMGSAWDTAYASLFLASDEARFITGIVLPVDGGGSARIG
ncbi:SDR family NAD(P)-dependent oxidoreductase [Minwuia sp.]|uniref:SDR family NAD(P)-dependent oxidoreductase n=1 Tax=Minwuia sp. TaxID=2493630 RepID=UPI003A91486E